MEVYLYLLVCLLLPSAESVKDILFLAVDDLRPELGTYGHEGIKSPSIDTLAAKSLVFERAYCQIAVCSPSRASLLTGRRPDTNHVWKISSDEYWRNVTNATTIPQYFKENGYFSIGMGKIFHPGAPSGFDDIKFSWSHPYFHGKNNVHSSNSWYKWDNVTDSDFADGQIANNAMQVLQQIKENRTMGNETPFFLAVGFHKPHLPFFAPAKYYNMYPAVEDIKLPSNPDAPKGIPPISWAVSEELINHYADMKKYDLPECYSDFNASSNGSSCRLSEYDARLLRRGYYAALSFTDAQIEKVLHELETQGLADNTIIVLWADHGWKLGEHNMWTKHSNMEDDTHVPFILRVPGVTDSGMRSKALVELVDIFPTVSELAGLDIPPLCPEKNKDLLVCVEGTSIVPLLKDPNQQWKKVAFSQYPRPSFEGLTKIPGKPPFSDSDHEEDVMGYSVRVERYHFIEWYKFNRDTATPDFNQLWGTELYDHSQPTINFNDENINVAADADKQEIIIKLRKILQDGWRSAMPPHTRC